MERVEVRHYDHSIDRAIFTKGLTPEQRRAVEDAVLPPMPQPFSTGSGRGDAGVAASTFGGVRVEAGKCLAYLRTNEARELGQRMIEFADAIEARKSRG